jgi:transposase
VPNDAEGVVTRGDRGHALPPTLLVWEATGGLARIATAALATAGRPGIVVHPRQARACARATGQVATTAALEARASCAAVSRPTPRPRPDAPTQARRALLGIGIKLSINSCRKCDGFVLLVQTLA